MLKIVVPECTDGVFDSANNEFYYCKRTVLVLEHSLLSISKWESKWCKPFLTKDAKTLEELLSYIECMTINHSSINEDVYKCLTGDNIKDIENYVSSPMTATTFSNTTSTQSREIITSELIYYWMIEFGIPFECEKWPINRLITLIRVCGIKNSNGQKMSKQAVARQNREINAMRRAKWHTKG